MAVILANLRDQVKADYKTSYDTAGDFPNLGDYGQTFSYVDEDASNDVKAAMVRALLSLTVYDQAPYKILLVRTGQLIED